MSSESRAIRKCGALLKLVEPARGHDRKKGRVPTRSLEAEKAGLSVHQRKQMLRISSVPTSGNTASTVRARLSVSAAANSVLRTGFFLPLPPFSASGDHPGEHHRCGS